MAKHSLLTPRSMMRRIMEYFCDGGLCRGRTYGPLIKSPAPLQPENTQDIQDKEFPLVSEDET